MLKLVFAACLIALAFGQPNHPGGNHHPHPEGPKPCSTSDDCGGCPDNHIGVCAADGMCHCEMIVKRADVCTTDADCGGCDANHTPKCVMHHDGTGKCHCEHNAAKRAPADLCSTDADCNTTTCNHDNQMAQCGMHGTDHNHCHCSHIEQACMTEADCTFCEASHLPECKLGHDGINGKCHCGHKVKRADVCTTAADCGGCDANHTPKCVTHHDGTGKCHCEHNAVKRADACTTAADCNGTTCDAGHTITCQIHHDAKRAPVDLCTTDADCNTTTCNHDNQMAQCGMHGHDHNHCHCSHIEQACMTEADCTTCEATHVPECKLGHDGSGKCHCGHKAKREGPMCMSDADCPGGLCGNGHVYVCRKDHGKCYCERVDGR